MGFLSGGKRSTYIVASQSATFCTVHKYFMYGLLEDKWTQFFQFYIRSHPLNGWNAWVFFLNCVWHKCSFLLRKCWVMWYPWKERKIHLSLLTNLSVQSKEICRSPRVCQLKGGSQMSEVQTETLGQVAGKRRKLQKIWELPFKHSLLKTADGQTWLTFLLGTREGSTGSAAIREAIELTEGKPGKPGSKESSYKEFYIKSLNFPIIQHVNYWHWGGKYHTQWMRKSSYTAQGINSEVLRCKILHVKHAA